MPKGSSPMTTAEFGTRNWGMVVDVDKCIGCNACVIACQAENNIPINTQDRVERARSISWIRVERYWEGDFPDAKARFIPIMCQHCENAPCEPVCPVYATYHNAEGMNIQVYNRCVLVPDTAQTVVLTLFGSSTTGSLYGRNLSATTSTLM